MFAGAQHSHPWGVERGRHGEGSGIDQPQCEATSSALGDGECDPDLEQRVDERFLVFTDVNGAKPDSFDHGFGRATIRAGAEKNMSAGPSTNIGSAMFSPPRVLNARA